MHPKLIAALIRAARSAAQAAVLTIGGGAVGAQVDALSIDYRAVLGFSLGMAIMSLLTSAITDLPEAD